MGEGRSVNSISDDGIIERHYVGHRGPYASRDSLGKVGIDAGYLAGWLAGWAEKHQTDGADEGC